MPTSVTFQQPRVPTCFRGEPYEDFEHWLEQFERVATFNQWSGVRMLHNVYFSLEEGARTLLQNREARLRTWDDFCRQVRETFANADRRDHEQRLLEARIQKPNESVTMFAEDMARLFMRADLEMPESKNYGI